MSYPGNPSLAAEIQQKILDTYRQTLDLAGSGQREEALLGCDFIRRLDPKFEPVNALNERLEGQTGAVPVDDLKAALGDATGAPKAEGVEAESLPEPEPELSTTDDVLATPGTAELEAEASDIVAETTLEADSDEEVSILESALDLSGLGADATTADEAAPSEAKGDEPAEVESSAPEDEIAAPQTAEPSAALDQESQDRIEQLLGEGQVAFEKAEYQSAIDAWSRIFLVDIDHPEANRRIELARKLKAEVERKVDETYHEAVTAMDEGRLDVAEEGFRKVLELQSTHLAAQEHLDRLISGDFAQTPEEAAPVSPPGGPEEEPLAELEPPSDEEFAEAMPDGFDFEPLADGTEDEFDAADTRPGTGPVKTGRSSRQSMVTIAGLALLLALVGAWFLYSNWARFFPNAGEEEVAPQTTPRVDPIVRAQGLHLGGNTAMAISQLRRLPPAHPQYAQAQALIAQWETVLEVEESDGPSDEQLQERDELVALAREAFANREFLSADKYFTLASQVAPLDEGAEALQAETLDRLAPLRSEIEIFRQGEWGFALRTLWQKYEQDPGNLDVLRLMVAGYYNLGVRDLQRGDPRAAIENLGEASSLAGDDPDVQRLLDFANTYSQREPDLLYRIFVKYVPFRS